MRRIWLVAVFALSLVLGVSAFAFGDMPRVETPQAHAQSLVSDVAAATNATGADGELKTTPLTDPGPNDVQSDVPECLDVAIAATTRGAPLHPPSPPLAQDLTPPVLDGPQRPPRGVA